MSQLFEGVTLDREKCVGCTHCMKRCPTEAIRVQDGKAFILYDRCVSCGECARGCPHHAVLPAHDPFSILDKFKYKIAVPSTPLCFQFKNLSDINIVLTGLKLMGFDDVYEVAAAAEMVSQATRDDLKENHGPVISSSCPAVTWLIQLRFPGLCGSVLLIRTPMEIAARLARDRALEKGVPPEDIGVFCIVPCPAQVAWVRSQDDSPQIDGFFAVSEVFPRLASAMKDVSEPEKLSSAGRLGLSWANIGGQCAATQTDLRLSADGIDNVVKVLEQLEDGKLGEIQFAELAACPGGCAGGIFNIQNPYVSRAVTRCLRRDVPKQMSFLPEGGAPGFMRWSSELKPTEALRLSSDISEAMGMMSAISAMLARLPGLDCASCGSPSCRSLAEDVVRGKKSITDCVFMKERDPNDD